MKSRFWQRLAIVCSLLVVGLSIPFFSALHQDRIHDPIVVKPNDQWLLEDWTPENVLTNVKLGRQSVGVYSYGSECVCGFVMYGEKGRVVVHYLKNHDEEQFGRHPEHLVSPYGQAPPDWIKGLTMPGNDPRHVVIFIVYEGDKMKFMGFDGNEEDRYMKPYGDEEGDTVALQYLRDQFTSISYYRRVHGPWGLSP
jgi:hypothetical protein